MNQLVVQKLDQALVRLGGWSGAGEYSQGAEYPCPRNVKKRGWLRLVGFGWYLLVLLEQFDRFVFCLGFS